MNDLLVNTRVTKEFSFAMSHRLTNYSGPCSNIHGHNYKCKISLSTSESALDNGMIIDFNEIKSGAIANVMNHLDHKTLVKSSDTDFRNALTVLQSNYCVAPLSNTTAEEMVQLIAYLVVIVLPKHINLVSISLFETDTSEAFLYYDRIIPMWNALRKKFDHKILIKNFPESVVTPDEECAEALPLLPTTEQKYTMPPVKEPVQQPKPKAVLNVQEIFQSIQGEGIDTGKMVTFVRLYGCNATCSGCDEGYGNSKESIYTPTEFKTYDVPELFELLKDESSIVFTGGEPTIQIKALADITLMLTSHNPAVHLAVETNGLISKTTSSENEASRSAFFENMSIITIAPKAFAPADNFVYDLSLYEFSENIQLKFYYGSTANNLVNVTKQLCTQTELSIHSSIGSFVATENMVNCLKVWKKVYEPSEMYIGIWETSGTGAKLSDIEEKLYPVLKAMPEVSLNVQVHKLINVR